MPTKIISKKSSTASSVPIASNLEVGEIAVNTADKKQYTKHTDNSIVELGTNPSTLTLGGTPVTATAAELNKLDGATVTTAELNILDGVTATTTELNYTDGVTSGIQTQLNTKAPLANPAFVGLPTIPSNIVHEGDSNTSFGFPAVDTFNVTTSGAERMRVDSAGNVGIGTASPAYTLDVTGVIRSIASNPILRMESTGTGTGAIYFGDSADATIGQIQYQHSDDSFRFRTNNSQALLINSGGDLTATGVISSGEHVDVGDAFSLRFGDGGERITGTNSASALQLFTSATERMRITSAGNVGIGTTSPRGNLSLGYSTSVSLTSTALHMGYANSDFFGFRLFQEQQAGSKAAGVFSIQRGTSTAWVDALTISDTGNLMVGLGDSTKGRLVVDGGGTETDLAIGSGFDYNVIRSIRGGNNDHDLAFGTSHSGVSFVEYMRIVQGGNVGIGTTNPLSNFVVSKSDESFEVIAGSVTFNGTVIQSINRNVASSDVRPDLNYFLGGGGGQHKFYTQSTERMRINSVGNVGIGTTAPTSKLESYEEDNGNTANLLGLYNFGSAANTNAEIRLAGGNGLSSRYTFIRAQNLGASSGNGHNLLFGTNLNGGIPAERMRIDSSGSLLVGCTSLPSASVSGAAFEKTASGVDLSIGTINTSADRLVAFYNPNGLVGSIVTSALTTTYNTASDERLKENIADAPSASLDIDAVQVRQFDWKADGSHQEHGFIAQELKEVAPYAVTTPEDADEMMSVDYSKLVPMMMKELQELRKRVAELETKGV